jgi:hypothetical protein
MIYGAFRDRWARVIAAFFVIANVWFVAAQPSAVIAGAGLDDRLFVDLANRIVSGQWLGAYDQFTLAKGPGYPLFIALSFVLGIPLPLAEHGLYLLACWLLVRALRPVLRHDGWALLLFAGLVWQPMSYGMPNDWSGTVVRQNLYTPLTVFIFAGLIGLCTRAAAPTRIRFGWALVLGTAAGWFWLTREESLWIVPSAAVLLFAWWCSSGRPGFAHGRSLWPTALAALVMALVVGTVSAINARHYGWFGECEFHGTDFADAYGALTRVKVGEPQLRVPVTAAMRATIYPVSPAFAELRNLLEHDLTVRWAGAEGREINGAMWMWALRDAVRETGHASNAKAAMAFYRRLAEEVNAACDAGRIPAGPHRSSFLPPWNAADTAEAKNAIGPFLRYLFLWEGFHARTPRSQSHGNADLLLVFRDLLEWPITPTADWPAPDTPRTKAWRAWRIGALQSIGGGVRWIIITAFFLGLVAWIFASLRAILHRRFPSYLWWVATAALGGVLAVFGIAFLIHVTSWPDLRPLRFAQSYPLIVLFSGVAIVAAFQRDTAAGLEEGSSF